MTVASIVESAAKTEANGVWAKIVAAVVAHPKTHAGCRGRPRARDRRCRLRLIRHDYD